jgi:hypothetical protein
MYVFRCVLDGVIIRQILAPQLQYDGEGRRIT